MSMPSPGPCKGSNSMSRMPMPLTPTCASTGCKCLTSRSIRGGGSASSKTLTVMAGRFRKCRSTETPAGDSLASPGNSGRAGSLVDEDVDVTCGLRLGQTKLFRTAGVTKEALTRPDDHGVHLQVQRINKVVLDQRLHE